MVGPKRSTRSWPRARAPPCSRRRAPQWKPGAQETGVSRPWLGLGSAFGKCTPLRPDWFIKRGTWVLPQDPDRPLRIEAQLLREMAGALVAVTRHGALYESDFRLRPYGASGLPAQSLQASRLFRRTGPTLERLSTSRRGPWRETGIFVERRWMRSGRRACREARRLRRRMSSWAQPTESGSSDFESALAFRPGAAPPGPPRPLSNSRRDSFQREEDSGKFSRD